MQTATMLNDKDSHENTFDNPTEIIIKKKDIGLEEYQHLYYQYQLFNNREKRDQYYEDLSKLKIRLEKNEPDIRQVAHADMKRIRMHQMYERKLDHDINGPKGLNWQCKQQLKRLKIDERNVERDLIRLNWDLTRVTLSSSLDELDSSNQQNNLSQSLTSHADIDSAIQTSPRTSFWLNRALLIRRSRLATHHHTSTAHKQSSISETDFDKNSKSDEDHPHFQQYIHSMNQEKLIIEQKLKDFLQ